MTLSVRHRRAHATPHQQTAAFVAPSLQALASVGVPALSLAPGDTLTVQMDIKKTFNLLLGPSPASLFNLAGAEKIFAKVAPPGMVVTDVHGLGRQTVVVEMKVTASASQGGVGWSDTKGIADMGILPALPVIVAFIAAHWVGLSLAAIGIFLTLGILMGQVRGLLGKGGGDFFGDFKDILKLGAVILGGFVVLKVLDRRKA